MPQSLDGYRGSSATPARVNITYVLGISSNRRHYQVENEVPGNQPRTKFGVLKGTVPGMAFLLKILVLTYLQVFKSCC